MDFSAASHKPPKCGDLAGVCVHLMCWVVQYQINSILSLRCVELVVELLQLLLGTYKVCAIVTDQRLGTSSVSHEATERGEKTLSGYDFEVHSLGGHVNKNTYVSLLQCPNPTMLNRSDIRASKAMGPICR